MEFNAKWRRHKNITKATGIIKRYYIKCTQFLGNVNVKKIKLI